MPNSQMESAGPSNRVPLDIPHEQVLSTYFNSCSKEPKSAAQSEPTSSLNYSLELNDNDKERYQQIHYAIPNSCKWQLTCSLRYVEDIMFGVAMGLVYCHPCHSYLLNLQDPIYNNKFSDAERAEIINTKANPLVAKFDQELKTWLSPLRFLSKYDEIADFLDELRVNARQHPLKYWLKKSIQTANDLFMTEEVLDMSKFANEGYLYWKLFPFINSSFDNSNINVTGPSGFNKIERAQNGDMGNHYFKFGAIELGYVECGLVDHGPNGTKEMQEREIKTPIMLRDMLYKIVTSSPSLKDIIQPTGLIISGFSISAMSLFCRGNVAVVHQSERLQTAGSVGQIKSRLLKVLELVHSINQIMVNNYNEINADDSYFNNDNRRVIFTPSFTPTAPTTPITTPEVD